MLSDDRTTFDDLLKNDEPRKESTESLLFFIIADPA